MVDITLGGMGDKPIADAGLSALGKILLTLNISSPATKERADKLKISLEPVQCGTLRRAAYLFRPEVEHAPGPEQLHVRKHSAVKKYKNESVGRDVESPHRDPETGSEVEEKIDPAELLADGDAPQVIPYWLNCQTEDDLPKNFTPNRIVSLMRPQDAAQGRMGLASRLRVASATLRRLAVKAETGELDPSDTAQKEHVKNELVRLRYWLARVRQQQLDIYEKHPGLGREETMASLETALWEGKSEKTFGQMDKLYNRDRLRTSVHSVGANEEEEKTSD